MYPCFLSATRAASSVGGVGDFCQRSGSKSAIDSNALKSLSRYKTSTKYSHSFNPCRRALDNTDITIADEEVRLTTEVRDIMLEGFRAGGCPLIDVLDAERSYRETMRLFVTSRADYWRAMYIYNSVVGINSYNDVRSPAH